MTTGTITRGRYACTAVSGAVQTIPGVKYQIPLIFNYTNVCTFSYDTIHFHTQWSLT
jgi:hypothetical protein